MILVLVVSVACEAPLRCSSATHRICAGTLAGITILFGLAERAVAYHPAGGWWDPREEEYIVRRRRLSHLVLEQNETIGAILDNYMQLAQKDKQVQGYLELQALMVFRVLAASQTQMRINGGVAEIGVHHGMSFAPLCLLNADAGEHQSVAVAVDVFEQQHLNTDASGMGDRDIFLSTLARWCGEENMADDKLGEIFNT